MEISNKALAILLVLAIVVSIGGAVVNMAKLSEFSVIIPTIKGITGMGTTGTVNVSLQATTNLNVTQTFVDFGVGYVTTNMFGARVNSTGNRTNWTVVGTFTPLNLQLENIGNVNLSVSVSSDKSATTYLGGTNPVFQFAATTKTPDVAACVSGYNLQSTLTDVTLTTTKNVCSNLGFVAESNELNVSIELIIPYDAPVGNKTVTLTFNSTQATA
jgi:hypothetical protein